MKTKKSTMYRYYSPLVVALALFLSCVLFHDAQAQQSAEQNAKKNMVNVYTSRKEELVKTLFDSFTKETGITVNFVSDDAEKLIARIKAEGKNTDADLFMTADIANLIRAKNENILVDARTIGMPDNFQALVSNVPEEYRDKEALWFGLSKRVRAIFYRKDTVKPEQLSTYENLVGEEWKNSILVRSSSNPYNQSLIAAMIAHHGKEKAKAWAAGIVANMARKPQGGDTDQLTALAAGEGNIAIANSYYYGRMISGSDEKMKEAASKIGIFFPNQGEKENGAHVNVSGGGIVKHGKNKQAALKLLEFLSSTEAQKTYAEVNYEYPVKSDVALSSTVIAWGKFKEDSKVINKLADFYSAAAMIADEVGWR